MLSNIRAMATIFFFSVLLNELSAQQDIKPLIDKLVELNEQQLDKTQAETGSAFLPYDTSGEQSAVLQEIIKLGMDGVPQLLKHLKDDRAIQVRPYVAGAKASYLIGEEYDFNKATSTNPPNDANDDSSRLAFAGEDPYKVTVGDMCYFALGQIVNRRWTSCRRLPDGTHFVQSPSKFPDIEKALLDEWGTLDHKTHRQRLAEDFRNPDSYERFLGAYHRLSCYYPETAEKVVLEFLGRPIASREHTIKLSNELIEIEDADARKNKLRTIADQFGEHYKNAIERYIEDPYAIVDPSRKVEYRPGIRNSKQQTALFETFGRTKNGTYEHPLATRTWYDHEVATFIKYLTRDQSNAIGKRVNELMQSELFCNNHEAVAACLRCLASRNQFGKYLADRLQEVDFSSPTETFPKSHLAEIARSKSPEVIEQLRHIAKVATNLECFLIVAKALPGESWTPVLERTNQLLDAEPHDHLLEFQLLELVVQKSPANAEYIFKEFLKKNTLSRCEMVCTVFLDTDEHSLTQKVLLPLLDDSRQIPDTEITVRDLAAETVSLSIDNIKFDTKWPQAKRDKAIEKIKEHCQAK